jgi:hypothetical protein
VPRVRSCTSLFPRIRSMRLMLRWTIGGDYDALATGVTYFVPIVPSTLKTWNSVSFFDLSGIHQAHDVVYAAYRFAVDRQDNITFLEAALLCRTVAFDTANAHGRFLCHSGMAGDSTMQLDGVRCDANERPPTDLPKASQQATSIAVLAWRCPTSAASIASLMRSARRGSSPMRRGAISAMPARTPRAWEAIHVDPNGVLSPHPSRPFCV